MCIVVVGWGGSKECGVVGRRWRCVGLLWWRIRDWGVGRGGEYIDQLWRRGCWFVGVDDGERKVRGGNRSERGARSGVVKCKGRNARLPHIKLKGI